MEEIFFWEKELVSKSLEEIYKLKIQDILLLIINVFALSEISILIVA